MTYTDLFFSANKEIQEAIKNKAIRPQASKSSTDFKTAYENASRDLGKWYFDFGHQQIRLTEKLTLEEILDILKNNRENANSKN